MFEKRSTRQERIDTGDYTAGEYATFLREIRFINRYLGDSRALRRSLFNEIGEKGLQEFSVLDVACGSGELLREIARFARKGHRTARLTGVDLNALSFATAAEERPAFPEVTYLRGDAFRLPFADRTFDYAISSLFFHHLTDEQIPIVFEEMSRVTRHGVFVIDLHRHRAAYALYKLFCFAFRISPLVTQDGSLSILRGFRPGELDRISSRGDLRTQRVAPFRLVITSETCDEP